MRSSIKNTLNMAPSLVAMVLAQYRIVISTVFAALHSVLAMCLARIYSLKHSTHSMRRALINEIRYMVVKALSWAIIQEFKGPTGSNVQSVNRQKGY